MMRQESIFLPYSIVGTFYDTNQIKKSPLPLFYSPTLQITLQKVVFEKSWSFWRLVTGTSLVVPGSCSPVLQVTVGCWILLCRFFSPPNSHVILFVCITSSSSSSSKRHWTCCDSDKTKDSGCLFI